MLQHMTVFGGVEALITGGVVYYLQRSKSAWILGKAKSGASR
jgi:ABC-type Co2+ transport system permease subunit